MAPGTEIGYFRGLEFSGSDSEKSMTTVSSAKMNIPITKPFMDEAEAEAAAQAIRSGWIVQGPLVQAFEKAVAARLGVAHAVAVTNCTSALHLALVCSGVGPGDEVIVPSFSFIASANAVLHAGATPVFVDIDPRTYNIDPALLEAAITPRTKAILPVDQIGLAADLDAVLAIAAKYNLKVVEDAAPAMGATYKGRPVGSVSPITCFSFHPRKSISTGEGGIIATNSDQVAEQARVLRAHGASVSDLVRHNSTKVVIEEYAELGYNYRMTDIQAAVGIEQLKKLDYILARRQEMAKRYDSLLASVEGITTPFVPDYAVHTYQSYAIRLDPEVVAPREIVMERMLAQGVATRRGVMAIHEEPLYKEKRQVQVSLPVTEQATRQTLLLPLYTTFSEVEQDYVVENLKTALVKD
jgi:dTDP-4-amino-4,6-dideoxygalactose transaminase